MSQKLKVIFKLKKIKEDRLKYELGLLIRERETYKKDLHSSEENVFNALNIKDGHLFQAKELSLKEMMSTGLRSRIKELKDSILKMDKKITTKKNELAVIMAEKKALENLLEKERLEEKRLLNKKNNEKLEDLQQIRQRTVL
jgi:flagellar export protein FliJ